MKIARHLLIMLLSWIAGTLITVGQPKHTGEDLSFTNPQLHTVLFYNEGWEFSLPVLELGSSQRLVFKFDELSREPKTFNYTLVHCDADWNPSRLVTAEYLDGFPENPVNDYASSVNTT
ncbi:MAG: DUF5103 domain-containing protein, partial [Bacteroidetes bacterium]|nr:DUF5103 domain-containing protein [Bacteroidota bacterium]